MGDADRPLRQATVQDVETTMHERSNPMPKTEKERMLGALFPEGEGAQATTKNVKFFLGTDRNVSEEEVCGQFNAAREQKRLGMSEPTTTLDSNITLTSLKTFLPE